MRLAIELAKRGEGWVNPNPQVGCVIVRDGMVIGQGWHHAFGRLHAEREALADCKRRGRDPRGACAFVTLEPCNHTGKTPPCTDALIEAGIARVVVGSADPNPEVSGAGISRLRAAGIEVRTGFLEDECDRLNAPFFTYITTGRPLMIAKYAMTLDGKIATKRGASKWITGEEARGRVHRDRARFAAVMVGKNTIMIDDPALTARIPKEHPHQPAHITVDSTLSIPLESHFVALAQEIPTYLFTCNDDECAARPYEQRGCTVITVPATASGRVDLDTVIDEIGKRGLDSVIVEGGPALLGALFDINAIDWVQAYIAPKVFGGAEAPSPVGGVGVDVPDEASVLKTYTITPIGSDILIEGVVDKQARDRS